MNDLQFRQLLNKLGLSWGGYRKVRKGVKKRIRRHMQEVGCRSMQEYFLALDANSDVRWECDRLMTVSISRFFRDPEIWKILEEDILPSVRRVEKSFRAWSAGCARGEEVYSLKILWNSIATHGRPMPNLEIWATDINPLCLENARAGVYKRSSIKDVPEELLAKFFEHDAKKQTYLVCEFLKEGIVWQGHNLLTAPPASGFHLVFLRNSVLTYFDVELKVAALRNVLGSLAEGGYLIIGLDEKTPSVFRELVTFGQHQCVFQKQNVG